MSPSFNLIEEPWIPCIRLDGALVELGLRETIAQAHDLREVLDNSPLVTVALHRLLLALLQRTFNPTSTESWTALWVKGYFPTESLSEYLSKWKNRFDLFHPESPFFQCMDQDTLDSSKQSSAKLAQELASGNNKTLFDHSLNDHPAPIHPSSAARLLIATQSFARGGGVSKPFNLSHAPSLGGLSCPLGGENLFRTLVLNLLIQRGDRPIPSTQSDLPTWERVGQWTPSRRPPRGYLDYLTWQSRRILLIPEENGFVRECHLLQGDALTGDQFLDPFMAYHKTDQGYLPIRFESDRQIWRDSTSLMIQFGDRNKPPENLLQLSDLVQRNLPGTRKQIDLWAVGMNSFQASVIFWRHERLPLPLAYLKDQDLADHLQELLDWSEKAGSLLRHALNILATILLSGGGEEARALDKKIVREKASAFPSWRHYWTNLELPFYEALASLPDDPEGTLEQWKETLRQATKDALEATTRTLDGSARSLRAAVEAEGLLHARMNKEMPKREEVSRVEPF